MGVALAKPDPIVPYGFDQLPAYPVQQSAIGRIRNRLLLYRRVEHDYYQARARHRAAGLPPPRSSAWAGIPPGPRRSSGASGPGLTDRTATHSGSTGRRRSAASTDSPAVSAPFKRLRRKPKQVSHVERLTQVSIIVKLDLINAYTIDILLAIEVTIVYALLFWGANCAMRSCSFALSDVRKEFSLDLMPV